MYLSIYLSIYLCLYHLSRVCRTLVPEICVCPEMLRAFWYVDMLTCVIYNCMYSTEQQGRLELFVSAACPRFVDSRFVDSQLVD